MTRTYMPCMYVTVRSHEAPDTAHTSRPWRIHELTPDFRLEDVWALPTPGGPDDFPRLVERIAAGDPSQSSSARRPRAVRDPVEARGAARLGRPGDRPRLQGADAPRPVAGGPARRPSGPDFDALPFTSLYLLDDEWAAEIANQTMHGVMHLGWVPDGRGGYRGQMAVLVKPNGLLGTAYMAAISAVPAPDRLPADDRRAGPELARAARRAGDRLSARRRSLASARRGGGVGGMMAAIAVSQPIENIDDPRLVRALSHPLRVRILAILEERTSSAVEMSRMLRAPLGVVAYHVRTLDRLGLIELVREVPVRGAVQRFFRARERPTVSAEAWAKAAPVAKQAMIGATLQQINDFAKASNAFGGSRPRGRPHHADLSGSTARGCDRLAGALGGVLREVDAIEREVATRQAAAGDDAQPLEDAGLVMMLFEAQPFSAGTVSDQRPGEAPAADVDGHGVSVQIPQAGVDDDVGAQGAGPDRAGASCDPQPYRAALRSSGCSPGRTRASHLKRGMRRGWAPGSKSAHRSEEDFAMRGMGRAVFSRRRCW